MTDERYLQLVRNEEECLTSEEIAAGWHFCYEFDGLLVGPGMEETQFCHAHCGSNKTIK